MIPSQTNNVVVLVSTQTIIGGKLFQYQVALLQNVSSNFNGYLFEN